MEEGPARSSQDLTLSDYRFEGDEVGSGGGGGSIIVDSVQWSKNRLSIKTENLSQSKKHG